MSEQLVICGKAISRKSYIGVPMKGADTGLRVKAYINPHHTDYRFLGENAEPRARAYAEATGGEYRQKTRPSDNHVEHLVTFKHDTAVPSGDLF